MKSTPVASSRVCWSRPPCASGSTTVSDRTSVPPAKWSVVFGLSMTLRRIVSSLTSSWASEYCSSLMSCASRVPVRSGRIVSSA